jgi:predicted dehydrogenase
MICMTGFKKRYAPAYVKAKTVVNDPRFGAPALLSIVRTSGNYGNSDDPRSQYILDSGIHAVDLAAYLFGRVSAVTAIRKAPASFAITLHFANGAVGTLALSDRMSYARSWEEVTAIGDGGVCIQVDNSVEMIAFALDQPIAAHKPDFVAASTDSPKELGFAGELQAFVDAISAAGDSTRGSSGHDTPRGAGPRSEIAESLHTMAIIEAIQKSSQDGASVEVSDA